MTTQEKIPQNINIKNVKTFQSPNIPREYIKNKKEQPHTSAKGLKMILF